MAMACEMVCESAQADFFVCDVFNAVPKGDVASVEPQIFSIATKPYLNISVGQTLRL